MKKLDITWEGIEDPTGYLFSFAKSLAAVVKNSPYTDLFEDIIATSGFAFRMWVDRELCPSATSIWEFPDRNAGWKTAVFAAAMWSACGVRMPWKKSAAHRRFP